MSVWLMGIVGVSALGILLDILIPEGETNKYIRGIFAIVTIFVIISPLPKLLNKNFDIYSFFDLSKSQYTLDIDFLNKIEMDKKSDLEKSIIRVFDENGFKYVDVTVEKDVKLNQIKTVTLNIKKVSIEIVNLNINIKEELNKVLLNKFGIVKEKVVYYE